MSKRDENRAWLSPEYLAYVRLKQKSCRTYEEAMALQEMSFHRRSTLLEVSSIISASSLLFFGTITCFFFDADSLPRRALAFLGEIGLYSIWIAALAFLVIGGVVFTIRSKKRLSAMPYWDEYYRTHKPSSNETLSVNKRHRF